MRLPTFACSSIAGPGMRSDDSIVPSHSTMNLDVDSDTGVVRACHSETILSVLRLDFLIAKKRRRVFTLDPFPILVPSATRESVDTDSLADAQGGA